MQRTFESDDYTACFKQALSTILKDGSEVRPRGMLTKEISPAIMIVDPLKTIYPSKLRNLNFAFLLAESLWYLTGRADTHLLSFYNSNIKNFSEDGLHDGAYGPKIMAQIRYVIETLKKDPDSRQAIISLWRENPRPSKDVPCTSLFQFMIRDGKLNLYVTMRSNDIIFGNNYDVPSFALIQNVVASCLGIPLGKLFHTANSLHLYEMHFELANKLLEEVENPLGHSMIQCSSMPLEEHVKQLDVLNSIEGFCRNANGIGHLDNFYLNELDPFYQQYVYVFFMFMFLKANYKVQRNECIIKLIQINSPFGEWYKNKYKDEVRESS